MSQRSKVLVELQAVSKSYKKPEHQDLLVLNQINPKLYQGEIVALLGKSGSGKSTLMRQLRDGKVENFPPPSEIRCVMVEHALQGEDTSLSIIDFVAAGNALPNFT